MTINFKSFIFYIIIISIITLISLIWILNILVWSIPKEKITVEFYLGGKKIYCIKCTLTDERNYSYYDWINNPRYLDIYVYKNDAPSQGVWVTINGCGINGAGITDDKGKISFSLKGLYLPSGISKDKLTVKVLSHEFYIDVVRG